MRVKKLTVIIISLLLLAACGNGGVSIPPMSSPMPLPAYPVIDGSSSTINLHRAIRFRLTGITGDGVVHSQTYAALERLVPGHDDPADVILAVKYYDETLEDAKNRGADLVITPIAKEGFVFFVNEANPVDSLTRQQIRDIYSGRITNWKDVGGNDEEIIPFTRNWDSGSQTAMDEFMQGLAAVENDHYVAGSMGDIVSSVAFTKNAIGYNIYSWYVNYWTEGNGLKLLAVDGSSPSNETLSDSSYPLIVYTYSYYNKGNEKGKTLTGWLLTAEAQALIASAGYVGIFGDFSANVPRTFYDVDDSRGKAMAFLTESGWHIAYYSMQMINRKQAVNMSEGKGKGVTYGWLFKCCRNNDWINPVMRFVILTREKGGDWDVISEGEWPH